MKFQKITPKLPIKSAKSHEQSVRFNGNVLQQVHLKTIPKTLPKLSIINSTRLQQNSAPGIQMGSRNDVLEENYEQQTNVIDERDEMIKNLRKQLLMKDRKISDLNEQVMQLTQEIAELKICSTAKSSQQLKTTAVRNEESNSKQMSSAIHLTQEQSQEE